MDRYVIIDYLVINDFFIDLNTVAFFMNNANHNYLGSIIYYSYLNYSYHFLEYFLIFFLI